MSVSVEKGSHFGIVPYSVAIHSRPQVGDKSTSNMTHCLCDHLTFFSAMVVKPNPIGPLTVAAFVSGYALFVAVAVVFFLYFLGLIWVRKKDRADTVKVSFAGELRCCC